MPGYEDEDSFAVFPRWCTRSETTTALEIRCKTARARNHHPERGRREFLTRFTPPGFYRALEQFSDLLPRLQPRWLALVLCRCRRQKHNSRLGLEKGRHHRQGVGWSWAYQCLSLQPVPGEARVNLLWCREGDPILAREGFQWPDDHLYASPDGMGALILSWRCTSTFSAYVAAS